MVVGGLGQVGDPVHEGDGLEEARQLVAADDLVALALPGGELGEAGRDLVVGKRGMAPFKTRCGRRCESGAGSPEGPEATRPAVRRASVLRG